MNCSLIVADLAKDLQHHMYSLTLGGKLFVAPIPEEQKLHRVLDLGTGTGIWAMDFGICLLLLDEQRV